MAQSKPKTPGKTRIQAINEDIILGAALEVFSAYGYRGTTVDQIAERAGMSKPNLLYYFRRKDDIYRAVLEKTLADWLAPLRGLDPEGEPLAEISRYVSAKMAMSRDNPKASRLFANEMLHGAPIIGDFLSGPMKALVDDTAQIIRAWIAKGQIAAIDPYHLIFTIWAMTQHYADFDIQIRAVLGESSDHFPNAETTIIRLIQDGLRPR
ncbi:TetR family transcriptional regulator C-terminal domain-containing protein [Aestuariivirga sp. YIM B02566]|uniref:TetR family transcriptional regulator C-terminal domain-containing protein n=1 Tax=Taklimakanibacter albus TaxID=2800327 RepID=A0ACC5R7T6_9HYPH|nr:TetR family transcriptional regulator C-terminal domain-containing protein [Aestuariivirga sp. YIM B02566]MBK1868675.1 TetR family transcriptional regulator C-terminal domain-containing protein [Aestuariivirga sp. YIM B02566]